jgi:ankyrin repeat protein
MGTKQSSSSDNTIHSLAEQKARRKRRENIFKACESGNFKRVKKLIRVNPYLCNQRDENGFAPLYYASKNGHADIVKYLGVHGSHDNGQAKHVASTLSVKIAMELYVTQKHTRATHYSETSSNSSSISSTSTHSTHSTNSTTSITSITSRRLAEKPKLRYSRSHVEVFKTGSPSHTLRKHSRSVQDLSTSMLQIQPASTNKTDDNKECVICLENNRTHVCVPCGHYALCAECSTKVKKMRQCPICRADIASCIKVFECA